jgi:uncharacterized protein involved in outer membrane biogenesis
MKRRNRLLLLLGLPLALALAGVAAVLLIPTDRIAALAADRAGAMIGREVQIDEVSLALFPKPGVALAGVKVAGRTEDAPPVATVRRVLLQPRLLPLLRRQVVVDAIVIDQPRLLVEIDANDISNLPVFAAKDSAGTKAETTASEPAAGGTLAFLIQRLQINDARLAYRDAKSGTVVRVDGLNQQLRLAGDLAGGELSRIALAGQIEIASLGVRLPEKLAVPLDGIRLRVEHRAALDLAGDSLSLDHLAVTVQELALEGAGTVRSLSSPEARTVALRLGAGPVDVGQLIRSLPPELLALKGPDGKPTTLPEVDGVLRVDVAIDGRVGANSIPAVNGTAAIERFALGYGELGEVVSGLDGKLTFSLDSLVSDGISGQLLGEPLSLSFAVRDLAAPRVQAALKTALDLSRARAQELLPDSIDAAGRVALDLKIDLPVPTPAAGRVDGAVHFQGVRLQAPALQEAVAIESGTLALEGQRLHANAFALRLGESDLTLNLDARGWLPLALGDSAALPRVTFDTRSKLLDLDAILGPADTLSYGTLFFARMAERPVGGRPVEVVAKEAGLGLPALPPMELKGTIRAGEVRRDGLLLRDVVVGLGANGERLELTDARFQMMGGGIQVAAQVGMPLARTGEEMTPAYPVVFSFQVQDVGAAPFFDTFTPFRDHLSGSLLLVGTGRAVLDENLLPLRESVNASGTAALGEGQLVNWPALKKLGQELGAIGFDTLTFKDWVGKFSISGPRIMLHETAIEGSQLGVRAAGALDFNGELDFGATVTLPPELTSRIRGDLASRLTGAAAAPDGRVPIGVRLSGPALSPKVEVDLSAAAANLAAEAKREAEAKLRQAEAQARTKAEAAAREAAQKAAGKVADKLLPGGDSLGVAGADSLSLPATADSARAKAEKKVKDKLCGIIKC